MRVLLLVSVFSVFSAFSALQSFASDLQACKEGYSALSRIENSLPREVELSREDFDGITNRLTNTLSGNLATVLRSEWKAKGGQADAGRYIHDLAEQFLSPATRRSVLRGLNPEEDGFVREVAGRLYRLEKAGKLRPEDRLFVRDPPAPAGVEDSTFTYYTRAVRDSDGGKHQLRIRNYVREVNLSEIAPGKAVEGIVRDGSTVRIARAPGMGPAKFLVGSNGKEEVLNRAQIYDRFGNPPTFFASPHGKKFKLEVKTKLKDRVEGEAFANLAGNNLVQKLDVSLTFAQFQRLFGSSSAPALERIAALKKELLAAPGADAARIGAVFELLEKATAADGDFLKLAGATRYSRSAFEIAVPDAIAGKQVRLQTTVDRELAAYQELYRHDGSLRGPEEAGRELAPVRPADPGEERHWELKVPKPLVAKSAGISEYENPGAAPLIEVDDKPASEETNSVLARFSLCQVTNGGKFLHICKQRPLDDRKELPAAQPN
jgi:hypothetical protein